MSPVFKLKLLSWSLMFPGLKIFEFIVESMPVRHPSPWNSKVTPNLLRTCPWSPSNMPTVARQLYLWFICPEDYISYMVTGKVQSCSNVLFGPQRLFPGTTPTQVKFVQCPSDGRRLTQVQELPADPLMKCWGSFLWLNLLGCSCFEICHW